MKIYSNKKHRQQGFTLVELLVVISLVGILAGITTSIINPVKQRKVAEDGVKQSNLQKYALGIEAYGNANSSYPSSITFDANNVPTVPPDLVNFLSRRPNGEPTGSSYNYYYNAASANFAITIIKSENTSQCFKYRSAWGKIKTCPTTTADCTSEVDSGGCI